MTSPSASYKLLAELKNPDPPEMSSPFGSMSLNSLMFNVETRSPSSVRTFHERKTDLEAPFISGHLPVSLENTRSMFSFIGIRNRFSRIQITQIILKITDAESELRIQTYLKTRAHPQMTSLFSREIWFFLIQEEGRFWNLEICLDASYIYIYIFMYVLFHLYIPMAL